jgi:CysZ protein
MGRQGIGALATGALAAGVPTVLDRPMLIAAFAKAIAQLSDPTLRNVLLRAMAFAAAIYALLCTILWIVIARISLSDIPWVDTTIDVLGGFAVVVLAILLFPATVSALVGLYLERVAEAVERRHYPGLPPALNQSLAESTLTGIRFALVALALNIAALPIYLILLFVPPLNVFVFFGVNGYLLGREYFELVAARRLPAEEAKGLRRRYGGTVFLAGGLTAFLLTIPIVNLAAPIIGTAAMVHILEALRLRPGVTLANNKPGRRGPP